MTVSMGEGLCCSESLGAVRAMVASRYEEKKRIKGVLNQRRDQRHG